MYLKCYSAKNNIQINLEEDKVSPFNIGATNTLYIPVSVSLNQIYSSVSLTNSEHEPQTRGLMQVRRKVFVSQNN
jgi:hypothetical protein